jgi:hypothetical protein
MYSSHGSLIAVACWVKQQAIWAGIDATVTIPQKTVVYRPSDKLLAVFVAILAGAQGLVEVNTTLRADKGLCVAFDLPGWPDQSTLSETVSACTIETVTAMRTCLRAIYQQHGRAMRHRMEDGLLILDVDLTGLPCGAQAEDATKGYFSEAPGRRGRQLGRVIAAGYGEVVTQALYPGKKQLTQAFAPLVTAAEQTLHLDQDATRRQNVLLRVDAGAGTAEQIDWAFDRGYHMLTKLKSHQRTQKLARSVVTWSADPKVPGRSVGHIEQPHVFAQPTIQIAIRSQREHKGKLVTTTRVLVTDLDEHRVMTLAGQACGGAPTKEQVALAVAHAYDQRGGGIETENRQDKQGLGLTKRNKKSVTAQEMLVLLAELAHNVLVWVQHDLGQTEPRCRQYGLQRLVRDVLQIPGTFSRIPFSRRYRLTLSRDHPLSKLLLRPLQLLAGSKLVVNLGEI